jgi:diguanylate cyclase (GGDEF)-like protein
MPMELPEFGPLDELPPETPWIANTVAILAIIVFVISGAQTVPVALGLTTNDAAVENGLITAFLLNIALVLIAWRRSAQLRRTSAERDKARRQATTLAYVDDVTELCNRRYLNERLKHLTEDKEQALALLLVDLDHFKEINDLHGHEVGDAVLIEIARRLKAACPPGSFCVRLGGDEFALLLVGAAGAERAEDVAELLIQHLGSPIVLPSTTARIGASIGIARSDECVSNPSALMRRADLAMYEAKRLGRHRWVNFDDGMEQELERRNHLETELREAIAEDRFEPYFQPIICLDSGMVTGFEVLARWRHPTRGVVEPEEFIEAAEQTGLIAVLSLRVMERALEAAKTWPSRYTIAVNVSPVQLRDPLLSQRILQILAKVGFPASRLEIEIAESSLIGDRDLALNTIESLRNVGVSIAIDDFGTGYSAHARLRALPFDRIKIDRGFVASLLDDRQCDAIVQSIVTLGKGLNIPITAEGVETEHIRAKLRTLGCIDAQGWLFARALSAEEIGRSILAAEAGDSPGPSNEGGDLSAAN